MRISLAQRFGLFLLLPVTLILGGAGLVSFNGLSDYLLEQWGRSAALRLERSANLVEMRLHEKRELAELIAKAERIPDGKVTQTYLIHQLRKQDGVLFVNIEEADPSEGAGKASPTTTEAASRRDSVQSGFVGETGTYSLPWEVYGEQEVRQPSGSTPKQPRLEGPCRPGLLAEPKDTSFSLRRCFRGGLNRSPKILVIDLSFDSLLEEVLTEGDDSDASACLVDGHGRYLAHTKPSFVSAGNESTDGDRLQEELFRAMKAQPAGRMLRGGPLPGIVLRYSHIPTTPWYLVFFSREEDILQPILAFRWNYLLAIVLLVIFTILLIRFNTRPVASSLAEIASAAQRVAKGNYDVSLHVVRSDEIGHLRMRFNQMVEGLRQRELMEQTFGRYVDRNVARRVIQRPEELHLGGEKHRVTILTSDLRGFTSMSEQLEPEDVVRFLNRYFSAMVQVVEKYGGVIVDFFGDSVLVFFDGMGDRVETRTLDAVKCAVEMQEEASRLTQENEDLGLPAIAMGIGIHTGPAVVGNIGSETRVRFGIVGSAVHETDQIQAIADKGTVIVSWETKSLVESELGSEIFREFSSNIDKSGKLYALDWTSADRLTADNQSSRPEPAADPE